LNKFNLHSTDLKETDVILDVGSGPVGIGFAFRYNMSFALDPLFIQHKHKINYEVTCPKTIRIQSIAEKIPLPNNSIEIVFCFNVIDHVIDPKRVFNEIYGVLKPGGSLYFQLNVMKFYGLF